MTAAHHAAVRALDPLPVECRGCGGGTDHLSLVLALVALLIAAASPLAGIDFVSLAQTVPQRAVSQLDVLFEVPPGHDSVPFRVTANHDSLERRLDATITINVERG